LGEILVKQEPIALKKIPEIQKKDVFWFSGIFLDDALSKMCKKKAPFYLNYKPFVLGEINV